MRALRLLVAFAGILCTGGNAAWAAPVPVTLSAAQTADSAKITLTSSEKVRVKSSVQGQQLVLTFEEAITTSPLPVLTGLREYVENASLTPDQKQLVFQLKRPCDAILEVMGNSTAVLLRPKNVPLDKAAAKPVVTPPPAAPAPAAPAPVVAAPVAEPVDPMKALEIIPDVYARNQAQPAAAANQIVTVKAEAANGKADITFNWPKPVEYRIFKKPDRVLIEFDDALPSQPPVLGVELRPYVQAISTRTMEGRLMYTLNFPENLTFSHRKEGDNTVVLTLASPAGAAQVEPAKPEPVAKPVEQPVPVPVVAEKPAEAVVAAQPAKTVEPKAVVKAEKPVVAAVPHDDTIASPAFERKTNLPKGSTAPAPTGIDVETLAPLDAPVPSLALTLQHQKQGETETLVFPWTEAVPAAMMIRNGQGWVAFGKAAQINLGAVMRAKSVYFDNVNAVPGKNHTLVTFRVKKQTPVTMEKLKEGWTVQFTPQAAEVKELAVEPRTENGKPYAFVKQAGFTPTIPITDELTGQTFEAVPLAQPGYAMKKDRQFVDFTLPATVQGLVVEKINENIRVVPGAEGVKIISDTGLQISPTLPVPVAAPTPEPVATPAVVKEEKKTPVATPEPTPEPVAVVEEPRAEPVAEAPAPVQEEAREPAHQAAKEPASTTIPVTLDSDFQKDTGSFFPHERWKTPENVKFNDMQARMHRFLSEQQTGEGSSAARLRLAQYYMAEELYPEALAILQWMAMDDPEFAKQKKTAALEGIAHFMRQDLRDAAAAFNRPELAGLPETEFWKQLIGIADGERTGPYRITNEQAKMLDAYPQNLDKEVSFLLTEKAIIDNNAEDAGKLMDRLQANGHAGANDEKVKLYRGFTAARNRNYAKAAELWKPLLKSDDRFIRARATLAMTEMQIGQNKLTAAEGIKQLEPLQLLWRGDSLELDLMRQLGQLYITNKQYKEGLDLWRELVANFPDEEIAKTVAKKMGDVFIDLFNKGLADTMPPLEALSLYYEFRELTPLGHEGDVMIQKLADRLVQVDLLARAAALLTHQVKYRLEGDERSMVAARLAYIHLSNKQPELALEVLDATEKADMPEALTITRKQLRAEALIKTKKFPEALSLVEGDSSRAGQKLATDALWHMQDWPRAQQFLENSLTSSPPQPGNISADAAERILRLAMSYQFGNNSKALADMRKKYDQMLRDTPYYGSFSFLTEPMSEINHTNIAKLEAILGQFDGFMKGFEGKVQQEGLSKAIEQGPQ